MISSNISRRKVKAEENLYLCITEGDVIIATVDHRAQREDETRDVISHDRNNGIMEKEMNGFWARVAVVK